MRVRQLSSLLLSTFCALIAQTSLWAGEARDLVGHCVVITHPQAAIYQTPAADSRKTAMCPLSEAAFILEARGEWVRADEGWFLAGEVVADCNAKEFFTKVIEASPSGFAYASRSWIWMLSSDSLDLAIADAEEAVRRDSQCALAFFVRAECKFKQESYQEAIADFTRAIELEPKLRNAHHDRAVSANLLGRHAEAMDFINAALDRWPKDAGLVEVRGLIYQAKGEYDKAIDHFLTVQVAEPSELVDRHLALTYRARGEMRLRQDQFEPSIADLTEAIKLDPRVKYAHRYRGEAYLKLRQYDAAVNDLDEAIRQTPDSSATRAMLGHALLELGRPGDAISQLNKSLRVKGDEPEILGLRGRAWYSQGKYAEAARDFERAIKIDPSFASFPAGFGAAVMGLGEFDRAIQAYNRAVDLEPNSAAWRRGRALALGSRGMAMNSQEDFDRALEDCSAAIQLAPEWADAYSTRGMLFGFQQQHKRAVSDFTKAISIKPLSVEIYEMRAEEWLELHQPALAIADLTESLRISPDRPDMYLQRSKAWSLAGNQQKAAEDAAEAERLRAQAPATKRD